MRIQAGLLLAALLACKQTEQKQETATPAPTASAVYDRVGEGAQRVTGTVVERDDSSATLNAGRGRKLKCNMAAYSCPRGVCTEDAPAVGSTVTLSCESGMTYAKAEPELFGCRVD